MDHFVRVGGKEKGSISSKACFFMMHSRAILIAGTHERNEKKTTDGWKTREQIESLILLFVIVTRVPASFSSREQVKHPRVDSARDNK